MIKIFTKNLITSPKRSRFKIENSFVNQLSRMTHENAYICNACKSDLKIRSAISEISKSFDKILNKCFAFKQK